MKARLYMQQIIISHSSVSFEKVKTDHDDEFQEEELQNH
jgi:hypothetical protein